MDETGYQKKERQKTVVAVYVILSTERSHVFLLKRHNTGYMDGKWDLPSGHVEDQELPREAAVREVMEESKVEVNPKDLHLVHTSYRPKHDQTENRIDLFFMTHRWIGVPSIGQPEKCSQMAWLNWIDADHLPESIVPHVRHALVCVSDEVTFSELSLEWLKEKEC